jgi:hypothetical protein
MRLTSPQGPGQAHTGSAARRYITALAARIGLTVPISCGTGPGGMLGEQGRWGERLVT